MKRYVALLRGINISGKNKISMAELKESLAELDFAEVTTYLNSGNVIFSSAIEDENILSNKIAFMIKERFRLDIPVFIMLQDELEERLNHAPDWWGNDSVSNEVKNIKSQMAEAKSKIVLAGSCVNQGYFASLSPGFIN